MNKYFVWDSDDSFEKIFKDDAKDWARPYVAEAPDPRTAALNFTQDWADETDQQADYLVWTVPLSVGKMIREKYPEDQREQAIKEVALCFRGYKTWNVEEYDEEEDSD
jgi:hypothetical protein